MPEINDASANDKMPGIGCEPPSAASVAGAKRLREQGLIETPHRGVST